MFQIIQPSNTRYMLRGKLNEACSGIVSLETLRAVWFACSHYPSAKKKKKPKTNNKPKPKTFALYNSEQIKKLNLYFT